MDDRHDSLARGGSNQSGPLDDQIKEGISPLHTRSFSKLSASLISGPGPRSMAIDLVRKISFFSFFQDVSFLRGHSDAALSLFRSIGRSGRRSLF